MAGPGLILTLTGLADPGGLGLVAMISFRLGWLALVLSCPGWALTLPGLALDDLARSSPALAWIWSLLGPDWSDFRPGSPLPCPDSAMPGLPELADPTGPR